MRKIIILLMSLMVGCNPVNTSFVTPPKINPGSDNSYICTDKLASNFNQQAPCKCSLPNVASGDGLMCVPKNQKRICNPQPNNSNGGFETSTDGGSGWVSCTGYICNAGYTNINGDCIKSDTIKQTCNNIPSNALTVHQISNDGGLTYGSCIIDSCNSNFTLINNTCVISNQSRSCGYQNGTGVQNSINGGLSWSACLAISCNTGYSLINNTCVISNQSRSCLSQNGTGVQNSINGGQTWSECSTITCNTGYSLINGICVATNQSKTCIIQNGTGEQTTINGGQTWSSCSIKTCNPNYMMQNNQCINTIQTRVCQYQPVNSNSGLETSIDGGYTWSQCSGYICNDGYSLQGSTCIFTKEVQNLKIQTYVNNFITNAKSRNLTLNVSMKIDFDPSLSNTQIIGACVFAVPRYISINPTWWNRSDITNAEREYAIYHELGHCVLDRAHKTDLTTFVDMPNAQVPVSMMYPSIISATIYKNNLKYYNDELFDQSISTGNVALYYNGQNQFNYTYYANALVMPITLKTVTFSKINGEIVCADGETKL